MTTEHTSACWFADCTVRIPMKRRFVPVPQSDGSELTETWSTDDEAVRAHLVTQHGMAKPSRRERYFP